MLTRQDLENRLDSLFPDFKYRPYQKEAILSALEAIFIKGKRYIVMSLPTGAGKSHVAHKVATVYNSYQTGQSEDDDPRSTLILTKTISLQNQYLEDFPDIKMLKGAENYDCSVDYQVPILPKYKFHRSCKYEKGTGLCEYDRARQEFLKAKIRLLNYAFYMTGLNTYQTDGLLICDEAHNFEDSILNMLKLELDLVSLRNLCYQHVGDDLQRRFKDRKLEEIKKLDKEDFTTLYNFVSLCTASISKQIEDLEETLENIEDKQQLLKVIEYKLEPLKNILNKLAYYGVRLSIIQSDSLDNFSIYYQDKIEEVDPYFDIKPIFIPAIVKNFVFNTPQAMILMSATAERVVDGLKLPENEVEVVTAPYIFDLANRPLYAITNLEKLNIDTFAKAYPKYCTMADHIISEYPKDTNVIIHSVSYKNAEEYQSRSAFKDRIIIPTTEEVRELKTHIKPGSIVVSPAITEGVDLGEGLARVQIFLKCPYPYLGDLWVKKKMELDEGWYSYSTMLSIIQGSGRGVRSQTDKADTFMLDPSFKRLFYQTGKYLPDWLPSTIKWIEV